MVKLKSKKILYVIGSLERGGCETHLARVLPRLVKAGYKISIFLLSGRGELADSLEHAGIKIVNPIIFSSTGTKRSILFRLARLSLVSLQLWFYLLIKRPSIVHFFLPASYCLGAPIAMLSGKRKLLMSRRSLNGYMRGRKFIIRLEAFLHKRMDFLLGNSKSVVKQLIEETGSTQHIGLIYNGIDTKYSGIHAASERSEFNIPADCFVMIIVANLIPYKGHEDLINALEIAKDRLGDHWRLLIVGRDDGIEEHLRGQVGQHGLADNVIFMGERNNVSKILSCGDVGLLVSHEEGFSNAILEGMAAGLPMVVTNVGGNSEAVIDGATGFVVPAKDVNAISNAIVELYDNPLQRKQFGKNSELRVRQEFSIEKCVGHYDSLYRNLLENKTPYLEPVPNSV